MKKLVALAVALAVLSFGALSYAHMRGGDDDGSGYGYGYGMGPGMMGQGMMGQGYGGGCNGPGGQGGWDTDSKEFKEFWKATVDLRKAVHDKMFELKEAYVTDNEKAIDKLEKEIDDLREKIYDKAKDAGLVKKHKRGRGYGSGWMMY